MGWYLKKKKWNGISLHLRLGAAVYASMDQMAESGRCKLGSAQKLFLA